MDTSNQTDTQVEGQLERTSHRRRWSVEEKRRIVEKTLVIPRNISKSFAERCRRMRTQDLRSSTRMAASRKQRVGRT